MVATNNCLRKVRLSHEETQENLAVAVNTTRQTIISIEKGYVKRPSDELMVAIAKHYQMPIGEIFFTPLVQHVLHTNAANQ